MIADKTRRWFYLFDMLPSVGHGMTTEEIHRRMTTRPGGSKVTSRTIQRDLKEIEDSGLLAFERGVDNSGKPTVKIDASFASVPARRLPVSTAITLLMVLRYSLPLLPLSVQKELRAQKERINAVLNSGTAPGTVPWPNKVRAIASGHRLQPPKVSDSVLDAVYLSLTSDTQLRATYRTPDGKRSERDYSILGLLWRPPQIELVVWDSENIYQLSAHRIRKAESLDPRAERPHGFDLDTYIAEGNVDILSEPGRCRVTIKANPGVGKRWRESPLGENQVIEENKGFWTVSADVANTVALRAYLLGWGSQVEVITPPALREWMASEVRGMAKTYRRDKS